MDIRQGRFGGGTVPLSQWGCPAEKVENGKGPPAVQARARFLLDLTIGSVQPRRLRAGGGSIVWGTNGKRNEWPTVRPTQVVPELRAVSFRHPTQRGCFGSVA